MTDASIEDMFDSLRQNYNYLSVTTFPGDGYTISSGFDPIGEGESLEAALQDACKGDRQ